MPPDESLLGHFHTNLSVGEILRRARLRKGLEIEDLEIAISVSAAHIKAIEEGRFEVLPGRVYALGFIRSYAEYVDLDGDKILGLLQRQSAEKIAPKTITPMETPMVEDFSLPSGRIFAMVFIAFVVTLVAQGIYSSHHFSSNMAIPSIPADLKEQMTALTKPVDGKKDGGAPAVNPSSTVAEGDGTGTSLPQTVAQPQIVLKAIENVWLEIRDSQRKTVFSRVLSAGEEYWIIPIDKTGYSMTLGNAGGLQIVVDGAALPFLGKTGQVIRNVALDHDALKKKLETPKNP